MIKIHDIIHFYVGCQYRVSYVERPDTFTVWSELTAARLAKLDDLSIAKVQIQLRPMSNLNEQEIGEYFRLCGVEFDKIINAGWMRPFMQIEYIKNGVTEYRHKYQHEFNAAQFAYLLNLKVDLFDLLESGQAIDATTINNQKG